MNLEPSDTLQNTKLGLASIVFQATGGNFILIIDISGR